MMYEYLQAKLESNKDDKLKKMNQIVQKVSCMNRIFKI